MGGLILAIFLSLLAGGGTFVFLSLKRVGSRYDEKTVFKLKFGAVLLGLLVAVVVFGLIALVSSYTQVEYGNVAVVTRFGAVTGRIFRPGLNWKTPFIESTVVYSTQKITYETSEHPDQSSADYTDNQVDTTTQDGQQIKVRYTVRFRVDETKASWVAQNLGDEAALVEKIVKTGTRIHSRNVAREFKAAQLYTGNVEEYQIAVEAKLIPLFEDNGLILDEFGVRTINFEPDYADAIEQKQIEAEKVATERYRAQQEVERKKGIITRAEAEAEKRLILSAAEATALENLGRAIRLNPEVLKLQYIEKLAPNIRVILVPGNQPFILGEDILGEETP